MNRPWYIHLGVGFLLAAVTPVFGEASEGLLVLGNALVLLDPHAKSADQFDACVRLRDAGDAAILAIPALARQSKSDQPSIRQLAFRTLTTLVGEREAA